MPLPTDGSVPMVTLTVGTETDNAKRTNFTGTITATPTSRRVHLATGTPVETTPISGDIIAGGGSVQVIFSDVAGFDVSPVDYNVDVTLTDPAGETIVRPTVRVRLLQSGGATQDLDTLVPSNGSPGPTILYPAITSITKADASILRGDINVSDLGLGGGTGAPLDSPAFTGTPTVPTAATDTTTTQAASTAFVVGQAAAATPLMDGTAAVGTSKRYARADHVHASDTTRAALAGPTFTGTPAAPTAAVDTNTTQLATTAYVVGQAAAATPNMDGTAAVGTSTRFARADHVHASDTSRAALAGPTFTGTPAAPTAAVDTNTTQLATTAFVVGQASAATPNMDGTAAVGTSTRFARADHIHGSDTSRIMVSAQLTNPRNTGNPLADAIMDGAAHALSTRFANLAAAQAVFPAATALTEQIDRHAIQKCLDAGSIFLPPGKAVLDTALLIPSGGNRRIRGSARFSTCLSMVAGTQTGAITCADMTVVNSNVEISDLELDGTGATSPTSPNNWVVNGLDVGGMQDSLFQRISSHDWPGMGIQTTGITSTYVYNNIWRDIIVANNMNWGFKASLRNRRMVISGLHATGNGLRVDTPPNGGWTIDAGDQQINITGGVLLDCSEMTATDIRSHDNGNPAGALNALSWGGVGIAIRNVYAMNLSGLVATGNGSHGIFALGFVDSIGHGWAAWNNGRKAIGTTAAARIPVSDVVFHKSDAMTYGRTKRSKIVGLSAGLNTAAQGGGWDGGEVWGLWVDDALTDLDIAGEKLTAGSSGISRLPVTAGAGNLRIGRHTPLSIGQVASGSWTGPRLAAAGTAVLVQNEARAYAWDVIDGILVSQLGIGVTVLQASAVVRLGIFKDDGTGQSPDTSAAGLIADCGTVSAAAVADVATTALGTPVLLASQRVWLVARQEGAGGTATVRIGTPLSPVSQSTLVTATESGAIKVTNWTNAFSAGFANGAVGAGGTITVVAAGVKVMARAA